MCEDCGFCIVGATSKHFTSRGHLRRQEFKTLQCELEKLRRADLTDKVSCRALVNAVIAILHKKMPDGALLFDLDPKFWKDIRREGPYDFRRQNHKDEIKPKLHGILDEFEAGFVDMYPELQIGINLLRGPKLSKSGDESKVQAVESVGGASPRLATEHIREDTAADASIAVLSNMVSSHPLYFIVHGFSGNSGAHGIA